MGPLRSTFFVLFLPVTLAVPLEVLADHEFQYDNVFVCGPQKVLRIPPDEISKNGRSQHFCYIHDNKRRDKHSIFWGDTEYPSFKVNHYTELYPRLGGDYWLTFQRLSNSTVRFGLYSSQAFRNGFHHNKLIAPVVLTFKIASMSAVREDWDGRKSELTCWDHKKRWEQ